MSSGLDSVSNPSFVADLEGLSLEDVRARRDQCQEAEGALSYVRRLVQGRLDIVAAALAAQAHGDAFDAATLVAKLPQILADDMRKFTPVIRPEGMIGAEVGGDAYSATFVTELEKLVDVSALDQLAAMPKDELQNTVGSLETLERNVSASRRAVQDNLDALQADIVRRYKSGEANVDNLLK